MMVIRLKGSTERNEVHRNINLQIPIQGTVSDYFLFLEACNDSQNFTTE